MSAAFNDDEQIVVPPQSVPTTASLVPGRVKLEIINNNFEAPLKENTQKVMLQLTGRDPTASRAGLDLVVILDVSGSMKGDKLCKLQTAMQFLIKKLGPMDRLSIVIFSNVGQRLCPLRQVTDGLQADLKRLMNRIKARGNTNTGDGLLTGLRVIAERKFKAGRSVGLMLMSDGQPNKGKPIANIDVSDVPVYTFGFGADHDPKVLNAIAEKSMGGTFSAITDVDDGLSVAFSQCLAGLLTVVVQDLKLTLESVDSTVIGEVTAGGYAQKRVDNEEPPSVTVNFGDLYGEEVRKVIVQLNLAKVDQEERDQEVLIASYSYSISGKKSDGNPQPVLAERTGGVSLEPPELKMEQARLATAEIIGKANSMADEDMLDKAKSTVVDAQNALEAQKPSSIVNQLKTELDQLLELMSSPEVYDKRGRAYALSAVTSHGLQRFAARGDVGELRLFATPRMNTYLVQAKAFDEDPQKEPPSADEDTKKEIAANPVGPIAVTITFYIQVAITALEAIAKLVGGGGVIA